MRIQCRHVSIEGPRIGVLEIATDLVGRPAFDRLAEQAAGASAQPGAQHAIAELSADGWCRAGGRDRIS